jgi:hypothetical protein
MRKLPTILAFGFISITLWRVGQFVWLRMGAGVLGALFSIFLGIGVYMSSYFTRDNITRQDGKIDRRDRNVKLWAWITLVFFVLVDAIFNMLEVWLSVKPVTAEMQGTALLYGAFPTVAAALLGALKGYVDKLPAKAKPAVRDTDSIALALRRMVLTWIRSVTRASKHDASISKHDAKHSKKDASITLHECKQCQAAFGSLPELASHTRWQHRKNGKVHDPLKV